MLLLYSGGWVKIVYTYNALSSGEVVEIKLDVDVGVDVGHLDVNVLPRHLLRFYLKCFFFTALRR